MMNLLPLLMCVKIVKLQELYERDLYMAVPQNLILRKEEIKKWISHIATDLLERRF
jgi:hypothetical protein